MTDQERWDRALPVKFSELRPGNRVIVDVNYPCLRPFSEHFVVFDPDKLIGTPEEGLFVPCDMGRHYLGGQLDYDDPDGEPLVGVRLVPDGIFQRLLMQSVNSRSDPSG